MLAPMHFYRALVYSGSLLFSQNDHVKKRKSPLAVHLEKGKAWRVVWKKVRLGVLFGKR